MHKMFLYNINTCTAEKKDKIHVTIQLVCIMYAMQQIQES